MKAKTATRIRPGAHSYPNGLWVEHSNAETFYHLERQGRTGPGLVPFIGAGISTAYGFKDWRNLLLSSTPPRLIPSIESQLAKNDYEEAAEILLQELGPDGFQNMVAASAGDNNLASFDFSVGTVSLLPLLASGPVVTTNFDRVIERAFEVGGLPFESVISGPRPDLIVDALHGNRRVLIKLHGDWQDRVGRTFAKSDYDANYGDAQPEQKRTLLKGAEGLLFSGRAMLFLGASLGPDRTVSLLQDVHQQYAGIRHFAIMAIPKTQDAFDEKEKHLRSCGVLPLWYHADSPGRHVHEVQKLLSSIIERISIKIIEGPPEGQRKPAPTVTMPVRSSVTPMPGLNAHFDRIVRLIEDGQLTFFLGAAIHSPTTLMADEFYQELARIFECEALREERFAVAQYIADRHGRENLYVEIRKLFARTPLVPRETHELFASWSEFKNQTGQAIPYPTIITTNYDDVLERRLAEAGLPYHLLSYQADGPNRGLFYHRDIDDGLRLIERPRNIHEFANGFLLVKLNGGLDRQRRIPESYSTTRLDYWDLAARFPGVLPAFVQKKVSANRLLFLGHGLAAPDIESFVRFAHRKHSGPRSWAVVLKKTGIEYWLQCGIEIVNKPVSLYVNQLRERLAKNGRATGAIQPGQSNRGQPRRASGGGGIRRK